MTIFRSLRHGLSKRLAKFSERFPRVSRFLGIAREKRRPIWIICRIALHIIGLGLSLSALTSTRTPQGAVAWIVSLNTIPVIAVPAYVVFGDNELDDYARTRSQGVNELRPMAQEWLKNVEAVEPGDLPEGSLMATLGKISSLPVTTGNAPELLIDGKNTYRSIFEAIDNAKTYILVQFYILKTDATSSDMVDRLKKKAQEGVRVYLLYDDYGSMGFKDKFGTELKDAGVRVSSFMNLEGKPNPFQLNYRNHRKLVVVDGITAFVGGHNVGDEYLGKHPTLTPWRDSHLRITGPVVTTLQVPFLEDWKWATGEVIHDLLWDLKKVDGKTNGTAQAITIATGPADEIETCNLFYHAAINAAQDRIWIATPYFVPDEGLVTALQLAAKRGVEVRIIIPKQSDSWLIERSAYSYLEELNLEGIDFRRYTVGFAHQKVLLIDDDFSAIGSANFDNRSLRLNFELTVGVRDKGFQKKVADMLKQDYSNSEPFVPSDLDKKSTYFKIMTRVSRLLAPIQ